MFTWSLVRHCPAIYFVMRLHDNFRFAVILDLGRILSPGRCCFPVASFLPPAWMELIEQVAAPDYRTG